MRHGRYPEPEGTQRTDESRSGYQHQARDDSPSASSRDGISVSASPTRPSRKARPGVSGSQEGNPGTRMLLAQTSGSGMPICSAAEVPPGFLATETRRQPTAGPTQSNKARGTRLAHDGHLGMSAERQRKASGSHQGVSRLVRSVELFVGAGGLGIGACRAGCVPMAVVDWNKWACDTIRRNAERGLAPFSHWPLFQEDVRGFNYDYVSGPIDIVTGGPPCQPFSLGGKHASHLDERDMFPEAIRAVRELQPRAFVFENVKGLARSSFATYHKYVCLQLRYPQLTRRTDEAWQDHLARLENHREHGKETGLEYRLRSAVLNAANFGVPQKRERIFFVGFRTDTGIAPKPIGETHSRDALAWSQWRSSEYWDLYEVSSRDRPTDDRARARALRLTDKPQERPWRTVREAVLGLPDPERSPFAAKAFHDHRFQPGARSYPGHTGSPLDEPAKTLKAGVHGVPGGENMLRRPDGSVRYFTIRESARLQTFPDEMVFDGSWTEIMRQLGNAVPAHLADVVVGHTINELCAAHVSPQPKAA